MRNIRYLSSPVRAGFTEFYNRYVSTNTRHTSEKVEVPFTYTLVPWGHFIVSVTRRKVGRDFLQMIAYPHLHSPPTLSVGLISILYGPGGKSFLLFPTIFPFSIWCSFFPTYYKSSLLPSCYCKVEVACSEGIWGCEGIAPLIISAISEMSGQAHIPAALLLGKGPPVPNE